MKAPDKVFFPNDINLLTKISLVIKQKGDVCYIRKDLVDEMVKSAEDHAYFAGRERFREEMLEWLEALKAQSLELREEGCGDVFYGAHIAILEETIHKIESL